MDKYTAIFGKLEEGLMKSLQEAGRNLSKEFDRCKKLEYKSRPDAEYFDILMLIPFYSGFRAETVDQKLETLRNTFPSYEEVAKINAAGRRKILATEGMIKNSKKVDAVIDNARVFQSVVEQYSSFHSYLESFRPAESLENVILLMEDLQCRFNYLGETTVFHFMTEIGLPVLKPDRVIMRIFRRLGLVGDERQFWRATVEGRKFAAANKVPIRYVDILFVKYGQMGKGAVCLERPLCGKCLLKDHCDYFKRGGSRTHKARQPR